MMTRGRRLLTWGVLALTGCGDTSGDDAQMAQQAEPQDGEQGEEGEQGTPEAEGSSEQSPGESQNPPNMEGPAVAPGDCDSPAPGAAPLRRLSNAEYRNTVTDLVGDEELVNDVTSSFPREPTSLGFRTSAQALTINPLIAEEYLAAAQILGPVAVAQDGVVPCDVDAIEPACVQSFVEDFGKRVYRRPLQLAELQRYSALYDSIVAETGDYQLALDWIGVSMFSSPHFLFRVELSSGGGAHRPDSYEMATRLSYLLWQTMPDEELFRAADAGELEDRDGIEEQVLRMIRDEKAFRVYEFFSQWLDLDEAEALTRSENSYPEFDDRLRLLLTEENRAFILSLLTTRGTFADMIAADYTYANRSLAEHYGLSEVPEGGVFERVPAEGRAGVLTQATMLMHDRPVRTSIVGRGLKLRTDFLCQIVPAPPDDVNTTLAELDGDLTQRERLELHRSEAACVGCHQLMDPLGEIFEGYDALGRVRETDEGGAPIVTGGSVSGTSTLDGEYENPRELALAMAQSDEVRECFALQAFRFFYGRDATPADACSRQQLMQSFARNDYRLEDLIMGLTRADQFLYRPGDEQ